MRLSGDVFGQLLPSLSTARPQTVTVTGESWPQYTENSGRLKTLKGHWSDSIKNFRQDKT